METGGSAMPKTAQRKYAKGRHSKKYENLKDPALLTFGMVTHTNAYVAMLRAITEMPERRF